MPYNILAFKFNKINIKFSRVKYCNIVLLKKRDLKLHKQSVCFESVFKSVHQNWAKPLYNFIYYKFGDPNKADDMVQEAFIKLWEKCKEVPQEKAKSFLFTVANNASLNMVKHQKVVLKYNKNHPNYDKTNLSPEYLLEEEEFKKKLTNAINDLKPDLRTCFLMHRVDGKKYREIAEILEVSQKTVEKRMSHALKSLREQIDGI